MSSIATAASPGVYRVKLDGELASTMVVVYPSGRVSCRGAECKGRCQHVQAAIG